VTVAALAGAVKRYGATLALAGLDLELRRGEVLALLGPNGAGKTTAISLLLGLRRADAGSVRLFGRDPRDPAARRRVGVTPQEQSFPPTLRVREILQLVAAHFDTNASAAGVIARFGLGDLERRQAGGLSGGARRRLACALAFVGEPDLVFLDEPTAGLDVDGRRRLWHEIADFAHRGGTVLLTTHYLEEAEALASRVVVLSGGRAIAEGTPQEVQERAGVESPQLEDAVLALTREPG